MRTIADKQISELNEASSVQPADLFVLEQSGTAKRLAGQTLITYLANNVNVHGGIASFELISTTGENPVVHTYRMTFADTTYVDIPISDGVQGPDGKEWHVFIRYSAVQPTQDSDISTTPDEWIGIYSGRNTSAPSAYTQYKWYKFKGEKGDTGEAASVTVSSIRYQVSDSGTTVPSGSWSSTIPSVPSGNFLWTQIHHEFNDGTVETYYAVSRNGIDGSGAVSSVNSVSPGANGNVALTADDIPTDDTDSVQDHITSIEATVTALRGNTIYHISATVSSLPASFTYPWITADHRVVHLAVSDQSKVASDIGWATSNGNVTLSGTLIGSTAIEFDLMKPATP